jgi:hypothetical protein
LIASSNTPEEICKFLGADSLGYKSCFRHFARRSVIPKASLYVLLYGCLPDRFGNWKLEKARQTKILRRGKRKRKRTVAAERPVAVERKLKRRKRNTKKMPENQDSARDHRVVLVGLASPH